MLAYHNDPAIKATYLTRVRAHREADQLIHGVYWEDGKGCAVGCTIQSGNHAAYETELGIPSILARLEDGIFEALRPPEDGRWPEQFLEAIPVGATLAMIWPQFALLLLEDQEHGMLQYVQARQYTRQKRAIKNVIKFYRKWVDTGLKPSATAVAAAAYAAAYAADAAAYAAAYAADAAAYAAAYAADAAAYAADAAAAAAAAADADAAAADAAAADAAAADAAAYAAAYAADAAAYAAVAAKKYEVRLWQSQTLLTLLRAAPMDAKSTTYHKSAT